MPIDWTKPIQTRDGRPARMLCMDRKNRHGNNIVVLVMSGVSEYCMSVKIDGTYTGSRQDDIINIPPKKVKKEGWINIYGKSSAGLIHESELKAISEIDDRQTRAYKATIKIEWEEEEQS